VQLKSIIDQRWAYLVYHGAWFHPLKNDLDAFIEASQNVVNGKYKVSLYKGNIDILERESNSGLFNPQIRSLATSDFNQRDSGPAVKIHAMKYRIMAERDKRIK